MQEKRAKKRRRRRGRHMALVNIVFYVLYMYVYKMEHVLLSHYNILYVHINNNSDNNNIIGWKF